MSPRHLSGTDPLRPISTSTTSPVSPNETPNNVAVTRLHHVSELRCRDALSLLRSVLRFQITHDLHLVGFQVSFNYQIEHNIFLVPTRRETRGVVWIIN